MRAASTVSLVQVTGSNLTYAYIVLGISLAALAIAYGLRGQVLVASDGTPKMREIAEAIQECAAAFLARQFRTLSFFVVIVFFLLFASVPYLCHNDPNVELLRDHDDPRLSSSSDR